MMALVASVLVPAFLLQHFYEAPDVTVLPRPEPPPPYYADYAYEPLGGRPIRVSLNGVEFNLPRGRGMSFSLVLDDEVRQVEFNTRGFERNPYQQQMLAVLEERHDAVPIIGFSLYHFGSTTGSPCNPDNGDWNVQFCHAVEALSDLRYEGVFNWDMALRVYSSRNRFYFHSPSFHTMLYDNDKLRTEIEYSDKNLKAYDGCLSPIITSSRHLSTNHFRCEIRLYYSNRLYLRSNYVISTTNINLRDKIRDLFVRLLNTMMN